MADVQLSCVSSVQAQVGIVGCCSKPANHSRSRQRTSRRTRAVDGISRALTELNRPSALRPRPSSSVQKGVGDGGESSVARRAAASDRLRRVQGRCAAVLRLQSSDQRSTAEWRSLLPRKQLALLRCASRTLAKVSARFAKRGARRARRHLRALRVGPRGPAWLVRGCRGLALGWLD